MNLRRLARKCLGGFLAWRHRRRMEARAPILTELRRLEDECRRKHKPTKHIHQTRRAIVHTALMAERRAS